MKNESLSILTRFLNAVRDNRDRILFNFYAESWKTMTYGEFFSLCEEIASLLIGHGLEKGDRAAIFLENRPEWCAAYLATLMCGGTAVPIDMQLGHEEVRSFLADSGAKVLLYSSMTESTAMKAIEGSDTRGINVDVHTTDGPSLFSPEDAKRIDSVTLSPDDVASVIYTSGTTGRPKGVMLTHRNYCSDADALINVGLVTSEDNLLSILPLHHTYPFMGTFLIPLFIGATTTFTPGLKAAELVTAIREQGVTIVVCVPRLLEMIRNRILSKIKEVKIASPILLGLLELSGKFRRALNINMGKILFRSVHKEFGSLKFFASGGARLEPSIMEDLEAVGFTILEGYGLSETSPVVTFNPLEHRKSGSVGTPLPGVQLSVSDDGEIMIKGPMVMKGYYKNAAVTAEAFRNGWFLSGDTGHIDSEGYLFVTGRKKEMIVLSSGKNIYPEEVEKAYLSIPLIKEICVTEFEKNGIVDSVRAVIVPDLEYARKAAISNVTEELNWQINRASESLPAYMRIRGFSLHAGPLPRTALGKLRRFMVKDLLKVNGKTGRKADKSLMADAVGRKVVECIKTLLTDDVEVQSSDNFELDLGFDSIKTIELVSSIDSAFSINLPVTFMTEVQTVGDLVSKLGKHVNQGNAGEPGHLAWKEFLEKEHPALDIKNVGFNHGLIERWVICVLFYMLKLFFKLFFDLKVKGTDNLPEHGPFIIAPNHASYLDGFVIASSVSLDIFRSLYFIGLQKFFRGRLLSFVARLANIIPIDLETYLHRALQMSAYALRKQKALCIFPEGGRSLDGTIMQFKKGIGILATELKVPVIPTLISGTFRALPRGARFIRPARIEVTFGRPVSSSQFDVKDKPEGIDNYQFFADNMWQQVIGLQKN